MKLSVTILSATLLFITALLSSTVSAADTLGRGEDGQSLSINGSAAQESCAWHDSQGYTNGQLEGRFVEGNAIVGYSVSKQAIDDIRLLSEEFPPYNFIENGKPAGTSIDLMRAILLRLHTKQTVDSIAFLPWARSYETVTRQPNTALFAMTRTQARETQFKWAGPISSASNVLIARKDRQIRIGRLSDAKSYRIGVVRDDAGEQLLMKKLGLNHEQLDATNSAESNIRKLHAGRIDLFAYDEQVARSIMKSAGLNPGDYETVCVLETGEHWIAFNTKTPDTLVAQFQRAIDALKKSGEWERIQKKYLGNN